MANPDKRFQIALSFPRSDALSLPRWPGTWATTAEKNASSMTPGIAPNSPTRIWPLTSRHYNSRDWPQDLAGHIQTEHESERDHGVLTTAIELNLDLRTDARAFWQALVAVKSQHLQGALLRPQDPAGQHDGTDRVQCKAAAVDHAEVAAAALQTLEQLRLGFWAGVNRFSGRGD